MALNREAIYAALAARLDHLPGVVTFSRLWKSWDDSPSSEQPAVYLVQGNEQPVQQRGQPPAWRLLPTIYVYARRDQPGQVGGQTMNPLIQAIEAALERQPSEDTTPFGGPDEWGTTLGGLCSHCRIAGTIVTDEGILGGQAVTVIPLEILTTS